MFALQHRPLAEVDGRLKLLVGYERLAMVFAPSQRSLQFLTCACPCAVDQYVGACSARTKSRYSFNSL